MTALLQHLCVNPLQGTLNSMYFTKLKLDHIQFMLEIIPMVMHNYSQFPCNFTTFCYLYQEDLDLLFQAFAGIISSSWRDVEEQGENLRNFTELLRN